MAPRPKWWHQLQASKEEVRLAVDLYNRSGNQRQLEAFIVHMHLGWTKLLQAHVQQTGGDLYERDHRGWKKKHPEGGQLYKPLRTLLEEVLPPNDARVANVSFFMGLRNRIEHRYEARIAELVAGRTQALLLNYESALVEFFGHDEALGAELRFPLFVSTITTDAVESLKVARAQIPRGVLDWVQDFDASLEAGITADQRFDFRIFLIPHTGPKSTADAAMTFVHADQLTDEQKKVVDQVQTIIREKKVPVDDLNGMLPATVVEKVSARLGKPFTIHTHTQAWRHYKVRPPRNSANPSATKSDFCRYNEAFQQYVYTPAWVDYLVRHLSGDTTYETVVQYKDAPAPE
ncbi:MAG TPA: DUF3644 domain-containing protein [Propionibacteriaceae bacterium]|nr:DUF3644 domain-containing protein [Propionibacteriaceae bacterium]